MVQLVEQLISIANYARYNEQSSHELTLVSNYEGPFNFVAGVYSRDGDEPYAARFFRRGQEGLNIDGFAACTGAGGLPDTFTPLAGNSITSSAAISGLWSCPGTPEDQALANYSNVPGVSEPTTGDLGGHRLTFFGHTSFQTEAVYFNGNWALDDKWQVFAGLRYDKDTRTHEQNDVRLAFDRTNSVTGDRYGANLWLFRNANVDGYEWKNDHEWEEVTWTIGVEHHLTEQQMVYGRISKGARAGGFAGFGQPTTAGDSFGTFDSETLINYEAGLKGLFMDQKLQLEAAVFFMDYKDHWVNSGRLRAEGDRIPGESIFEGEMNVIDGTWIGGLEISGAYKLTDTLTLRGFYNYMDSEVGDFTTVYCCDATQPTIDVDLTLADGTVVTQSSREAIKFGGNRLPLMPTHKYSLTALWSPEIPRGSLTLLGTYSFTGERDPDLSNLKRFELPSYTRLDLRAVWDSPEEDFKVTLYVKNALDEIAVQQFRPIETGTGARINGSLTDEREVGVSVIWQMF